PKVAPRSREIARARSSTEPRDAPTNSTSAPGSNCAKNRRAPPSRAAADPDWTAVIRESLACADVELDGSIEIPLTAVNNLPQFLTIRRGRTRRCRTARLLN